MNPCLKMEFAGDKKAGDVFEGDVFYVVSLFVPNFPFPVEVIGEAKRNGKNIRRFQIEI